MEKIHLSLIIVGYLLILSATVNSQREYGCKDEGNKDVDWFVLYKFPRKTTPPTPSSITPGQVYAYISSATQQTARWTLSALPIGASNSMLGNTLAKPLLKPETGLIYSFNDQLPKLPNTPTADYNETIMAQFAHSKGFIAANIPERDGTGVWISHSIPRLAPKRGTPYQYPSNGQQMGQTVLCLSLTAKVGEYDNMINTIKSYVTTLNPQIASSFVPEIQNASRETKELKEISLTRYVSLSLRNAKATIRKGNDVTEKDFYQGQSLLGVSYVQTWRPTLEDNIGTGSQNIPVIAMTPINQPTFRWNGGRYDKATKKTGGMDHSKWGFSTINDKVCIGDLNRFDCKQNRDGGAICFENAAIYTAYQSLTDAPNLVPDVDDTVEDDVDKCEN